MNPQHKLLNIRGKMYLEFYVLSLSTVTLNNSNSAAEAPSLDKSLVLFCIMSFSFCILKKGQMVRKFSVF